MKEERCPKCGSDTLTLYYWDEGTNKLVPTAGTWYCPKCLAHVPPTDNGECACGGTCACDNPDDESSAELVRGERE
jgi:hypothetical protein